MKSIRNFFGIVFLLVVLSFMAYGIGVMREVGIDLSGHASNDKMGQRTTPSIKQTTTTPEQSRALCDGAQDVKKCQADIIELILLMASSTPNEFCLAVDELVKLKTQDGGVLVEASAHRKCLTKIRGIFEDIQTLRQTKGPTKHLSNVCMMADDDFQVAKTGGESVAQELKDQEIQAAIASDGIYGLARVQAGFPVPALDMKWREFQRELGSCPRFPVDPLQVTPSELWYAFHKNEVAAQLKYGDKALELTGTIQEISINAFHDIHLKFYGGDNMFMRTSANLGHDPQTVQWASKLNKGDKVSIICHKIIMVLGSPMLSNCD